jgi:hypothetical protein
MVCGLFAHLFDGLVGGINPDMGQETLALMRVGK